MILRYIAEPGCEPSYATDGAAGIDLRAAEDVWVGDGDPVTIRTGVRVQIPPGHVGLVRGRSGMAFRDGLWVFEGTIDEDYRGEIKVQVLMVYADEDVGIHRGDRIAQLVIVPVVRCELEAVTELSATERGNKGFGSTGVR